MKAVTKDQLQNFVGKETGVSEWLTIDQERINVFADVTLDNQFIHVDPEAAAKSPFGTTIAHGFLTLSLLSHFSLEACVGIEGTQMGVNYGLDKVRFLAPVKVDSRIRARVVLKEVTEKPGNRFLMKNEFTIEIEGEDTPALIAEWLFLAFVA
ncbi:nodulation protein NodN [Kordiimonas sediminis]|uniref:Nodulation protein NodN n=1 Tax=Kordiimonas sediminis TaxID=1735581 RepID=A0A919AVH3_9PROT|nr:MaoC family dehydratase [Kordiimonas sediminis]GHF26786.1 nodulation protein NodN [Kordiimonas sediminis]